MSRIATASARTPEGTMPNKLTSCAMSKRSMGLLCIALSLAAWGYKAEAAMGLVFVSIALGGSILGFALNRPLQSVGGTGKHSLEPRQIERPWSAVRGQRCPNCRLKRESRIRCTKRFGSRPAGLVSAIKPGNQ
jgi:hypothetical protein